MALDPNYIPLGYLEEYFVDKDTGLPLSAGKVYFYSDINRSLLKNIYTITGTAPNYNYVALPNPSTLSGVGTFQDGGGNNIVPYAYPYDANGDIENYFIEVFSSGGVPQFTREAVPNIGSSSDNTPSEEIFNYIPNGQFFLHNNIVEQPLSNILEGQITESVTPIAQGGWYFERPNASTANDFVKFFQYGGFVTNPNQSPRYAVQIQCLGPNPSDAYKYLGIRFSDVNKFSSSSQKYTLGFNAVTLASGNFSVTLNIKKFYGTGGSPSPTTITTLTSLGITATQSILQHTFSFGANTGTQVGDNGDDYVEILIGFPTNISFGAILTDFLLGLGSFTVTGFPPTTNSDFIVRSYTQVVADPDGFNLYLPMIQTKEGFVYDDSNIGKIYSSLDAFPSSLSATTNEMLCDGNSYPTQGYSPLGIPYARVQKRLYNGYDSIPLFGTGQNFVTMGNIGNRMQLFGNMFGSATPPAQGAISTGFTFFLCNLSRATSFGYGVSRSSTNQITFVSSIVGDLTTNLPTVGTAPVTINIIITNTYRLIFNVILNSMSGLAGTYFTFSSLTGGLTHYYVWFNVDGSGSDPAPGGTGIEVKLQSVFAIDEIIVAIATAINGVYNYNIAVPGVPSAGSYFTFSTRDSKNYHVYYIVNGSGTDPVIANSIPIPVRISSGDSTSTIGIATRTAIHMMYFSVPDYRGLILRGIDPNRTWDLDADERLGNSLIEWGGKNSTNPYNCMGTLEIDGVLAHDHSYITGIEDDPIEVHPGTYISTFTPLIPNPSTQLINPNGIYENRVVNSAINWVIKY